MGKPQPQVGQIIKESPGTHTGIHPVEQHPGTQKPDREIINLWAVMTTQKVDDHEDAGRLAFAHAISADRGRVGDRGP